MPNIFGAMRGAAGAMNPARGAANMMRRPQGPPPNPAMAGPPQPPQGLGPSPGGMSGILQRARQMHGAGGAGAPMPPPAPPPQMQQLPAMDDMQSMQGQMQQPMQPPQQGPSPQDIAMMQQRRGMMGGLMGQGMRRPNQMY